MTKPPPGFVDEPVELGSLSIVLRRPVDADRLIDEERFEGDGFLPYWAEVWPSGLALADHVAGLDLENVAVLELGCGLALPSFAAALRGASVLATDWAPEAIDLVRINAMANALALGATVLAWGDEWAGAAGRFDLVLAADVLYEERNAEPLLRLLDRLVAPGGGALFADPGRRHAAAFFDRAGRAGWTVEHIPVAALPAGGIARLARPETMATG